MNKSEKQTINFIWKDVLNEEMKKHQRAWIQVYLVLLCVLSLMLLLYFII
jgi:predicted nucleic acid-binding Zn ribbon protein